MLYIGAVEWSDFALGCTESALMCSDNRPTTCVRLKGDPENGKISLESSIAYSSLLFSFTFIESHLSLL